jgi:hypothetical protein
MQSDTKQRHAKGIRTIPASDLPATYTKADYGVGSALIHRRDYSHSTVVQLLLPVDGAIRTSDFAPFETIVSHRYKSVIFRIFVETLSSDNTQDIHNRMAMQTAKLQSLFPLIEVIHTP